MGSGDKFRISWLDYGVGLGLYITPRAEHDLSINICLIKIQIYIGFGKGYDER